MNDNKKSKKIKTIFNIDDKRYGLVKWKTIKEQFNVLPMSDFEKLDDTENDYQLEKEYKVLFNKAKYFAKLVFIGSKIECEEKENLIVSYLVDPSLKSKISKSASAKTVKETCNKIREEGNVNLLQSQVDELNLKLQEKDSIILTQSGQIKELNKKIELLIDNSNKKEKDLDLCNKQKLLSIATCIFNNYGSSVDLENVIISQHDDFNSKMVSISSNFYEYKMPINLKHTLISMDANKKSTSAIFRTLINGILTDQTILANSNAEILIEKHLILQPCRDFMAKIRPEFSKELMNKVLRELCSEARQRIWEKNPDYVFEVCGKKLAKPIKIEQAEKIENIKNLKNNTRKIIIPDKVDIIERNSDLVEIHNENNDYVETNYHNLPASNMNSSFSYLIRESNRLLNNEFDEAETQESPFF